MVELSLPEFIIGGIPFFVGSIVVFPCIIFSVPGSLNIPFSLEVGVSSSSGIIPELLKLEFLEVILEFPFFFLEFIEVSIVFLDGIVSLFVSFFFGISCFSSVAVLNDPEGVHLFLDTVDLRFKTFKFRLVVVHHTLSVVLSFFSSAGSSIGLLLIESVPLDTVLVVPFIKCKVVPVLLFFDSGPGLISTLLILSPEVKILFGHHELIPHLVLSIVLVVEILFIVEG